MEKRTLLVCANLDGPGRCSERVSMLRWRTCIPEGLVSSQAESKKRSKAREVPSFLEILITFLTLRSEKCLRSNWAFELLPSRGSHALHQCGCRCQIRCSAWWKPRRNVGRNSELLEPSVVKLFKQGPISNRMLSFNRCCSHFSLFSSGWTYRSWLVSETVVRVC